MNNLHKQKLRINRSYIVDNLLCEEEVLDHILSEEVLSEAIVDNIRHTRERRQKIRLILDVLDKKSDEKFKKFCSILDKTNNDMIAAKLRDSAPPSSSSNRLDFLAPKVFGIMSEEDKAVFRKLHVEFVENMIDVENVMDSLMSQELLNQAHRSVIFQHTDRRQQVRHLMTILPKKGKTALPALLTALKTSVTR